SAWAVLPAFPASPAFLANLEELTHLLLGIAVAVAQFSKLRRHQEAKHPGLRVVDNLVSLRGHYPVLEFFIPAHWDRDRDLFGDAGAVGLWDHYFKFLVLSLHSSPHCCHSQDSFGFRDRCAEKMTMRLRSVRKRIFP